ncbi:hypothetical protein KR222_004251 [Zaprionus bogoriensis]|nr:hypothetical protein KR222_004251 [Zaprionus bogoriensis]
MERALLILSVAVFLCLHCCSAEILKGIKANKTTYIATVVKCGKNAKVQVDGSCKCDDNYEMHAGGSCRPICVPPCGQNADCIKPSLCMCKQGYVGDVHAVCQAICSHGCDIGHCVAPEKCACPPGYVWHADTHQCVLLCNPHCGNNSFCKSANHCECLNGFKPDDEHSINCSVPVKWWIYLLIGLLALIIVISVCAIVYCCCCRARNFNYYPNSNVRDTTAIIS